MKKILTILFLALFAFNSSFGQWYTRKYQVSDINLLTREQLNESLKDSKSTMWISTGCAALFGAGFLFFQFTEPSLSEDPGWLEKEIGAQGMYDVGAYTMAGLTVAGTIVAFDRLGRTMRIRSVIRKHFPAGEGSIHLSATPILNRHTRTYHPGFTLTYNF